MFMEFSPPRRNNRFSFSFFPSALRIFYGLDLSFGRLAHQHFSYNITPTLRIQFRLLVCFPPALKEQRLAYTLLTLVARFQDLRSHPSSLLEEQLALYLFPGI